MSDRRVLVIYDTRYGNTWKVAAALTEGLGSVAGVEAACRPLDQVRSDDLEVAECIIIGGPTEFFSTSHHMKEFFRRISGYDLHRKYGFAFDTHARGRLAGSAATSIERQMKTLGMAMLEPHQSAFTLDPTGGRVGGNRGRPSLEAGSEEHFRSIGAELGRSLLDHPLLVSSSSETEGQF